MNEPKFVPGERVIIFSPDNTDHLKEGVVTDVIYSEWDGHDGEDLGSGYGYKTDADTLPKLEYWDDTELRKLPPNTPSTFEECIFKPEKVNV